MKKNTFSKNDSPSDKKAALYNPYLDVLGGGEKHILSILKVLADKKIKITIFYNQNLEKQIKDRFDISFPDKIEWSPDLRNLSFWKKLSLLKRFNYFFYVTDGSYFISTAKKNFIFAMVPNKKLYQLSLWNRVKLFNYKFISNSPFTSYWLKKWHINSIVIPPYIDNVFFRLNNKKKESIILMVGRFYSHLHSKNQSLAIELFKKIKQKYHLFKKFKLIIAGGMKKEDHNYFNKLKKAIAYNQDIILKPNLSFEELINLYQKAKYFWHFTGLSINEKLEPERVEHLGITPLEAAASGCLVFCHNSGGPKLIFKNNLNGFLFKNEDEIITQMIKLEKNPHLVEKITSNAKKIVQENFSYQIFKKKVERLIE